MPDPCFVIVSFAIHASLLLWIGGAVFFTAIAAPRIFAGTPTRTLAGEIVGGMVGAFGRVKLVCIVVLILGASIRYSQWEAWNAWTAARFTFIGLAGALELFAAFVIGPRIMKAKRSVREAGLDFEGNPDDPRRRRFRRLHGLVMALQSLAVMFAIGALVTFS